VLCLVLPFLHRCRSCGLCRSGGVRPRELAAAGGHDKLRDTSIQMIVIPFHLLQLRAGAGAGASAGGHEGSRALEAHRARGAGGRSTSAYSPCYASCAL
jgi:hypothetical protein